MAPPAEVRRSVTVGSDTHTEAYLYACVASGVNCGRQESVTLRRGVESG